MRDGWISYDDIRAEMIAAGITSEDIARVYLEVRDSPAMADLRNDPAVREWLDECTRRIRQRAIEILGS